MPILLLTLGGVIDTEQISIAGDTVGKDFADRPVSQAVFTLLKVMADNETPAEGKPHAVEHQSLSALGATAIESSQMNWVADTVRLEAKSYDRIIVTMPSDYTQSFAYGLSRRFIMPPGCPIITTGAEGPLGDDIAFNALNNLQMAAFDTPGLLPGFYSTSGNKLRSATPNHAPYHPRRAPRMLIRHSPELAAIANSAPRLG